MNILKYIYLFLCISIFIHFCYIKEKYTGKFREFRDLGNLSHANIDELEVVGLGRARSKAFMKKIRAAVLKKIPPNSVNPGDRCTSTIHKQCKGDSICFDGGKTTPICTAGKDGLLPVGILDEPNAYGNYDNGSTHCFPRNREGCL